MPVPTTSDFLANNHIEEPSRINNQQLQPNKPQKTNQNQKHNLSNNRPKASDAQPSNYNNQREEKI
jgi:hypothetical protein